MNRKLFILIFLISATFYAQKQDLYTFGKISKEENDLNIYAKDTTANAVVLFENGSTEFKINNGRIIIQTKYYTKLKIFNKEGFGKATIEIPLYRTKDRSEKVIEIRGYTHNGYQKTVLNPKNIYTEETSEKIFLVKFTMPNINEQSIIEYEYILESPFLFNFTGWNFQSDIPTIYSRFYALIPGNYIYNRSLSGFKKLSENVANIKKSCFKIPNSASEAECEELTYAMSDVPAFIEEDYMTSKKNYISRIKFELSEFKGFDGINQKFTKKWKDADREFKSEPSIGRQLKKIDYIQKKLPKEIFVVKDELTKAKMVYEFIKNHFSWNKKIRLFTEIDLKSAFEDKVGNSTEINVALINALNAVGLNAEIVLLSTRDNGLPTQLHPVISDFNYALAKISINEKNYLLDATDKLLPFGMIPFKALNAYGRVMNFEEGSYWIDLKPIKNNLSRLTLNLKLNDDGNFEGQMHKSFNGYKAIEKREEILTSSEEDYLSDIENLDSKFVISSYQNFNLQDINEPFKELFDITIESNLNENVILLNPFINSKITTNPFKLNERTYPVDFGYPRAFQYSIQLEIPQNYMIKYLPENVAIQLPNNGGSYIFNIEQIGNKIKMHSRFSISKSYFIPEEYPYLKEFYNQIIKTQKSLITLEKI
ncbi:MAG: DUF3857 domain-containing protein [Flavobacteriaceae bacterium]|nr:DUF3857 domain-containing protein [Flavobacteriaceae bacterium]